MFLSSLVKTQTKSNALNNLTLARTSKNYLNPFIKIQMKNVSRSLTSRENREKYDLKKMDDYWDSVDAEFNRRMDIAKQIEEKYKTKSENLISKSHLSASDIKEIYFVPLTKSDENILIKYFPTEVHQDIRKGGRLVLLNEVRKHNKTNLFNKIDFDYQPLDVEDFEKIKKNFNCLISEKQFFVVALQQGKKIFEFLDAFKIHKDSLHKNVSEAFRQVEHLEAIESNHPLRNNLNVNLRKIENSNWIKNLLDSNKLNEKILGEKFNQIYFDFLDCLNNAAAISRGYDIELFEDGSDVKKIGEIAKKEVKDKLNKITTYLDSIDNAINGDVLKKTVGDSEKKLLKAPLKKFMGDKNVNKPNDAKTESDKNTDVSSDTKDNDNIQNSNEKDESDNENQIKYLFDPDKDYSDVFDKAEKDLKFDEFEFIRYVTDQIESEEEAILKSFYAGRLKLRLKHAQEQLSHALEVFERNSNASFIYSTENLIKSQEIDKIIKELNSLKAKQNVITLKSVNTPKFVENKLDIENKENLLKLIDDPRAFLQNIYYDLIKAAVEDKDLKIPESANKDKETYLFRVLLKYFADVMQSKNQEFVNKESRLEYFGNDLKLYKIYDNSNEVNIEDKENPENLQTPNFKKLVEYLHSKYGLIEKSVYDFKFKVENKNFEYPWTVVDLGAKLPANDGLGKEVLNFYLENSNEKNLLNNKDEEKIFSYVAKYLADYKNKELINETEEDNSNFFFYFLIKMFKKNFF